MRRNVDALAEGEFDLLVIGGGMHGAWIALRAIQAGCSVALVEKSDFAAGTSANSLRILHGGLRYLQQLDLARVRTSVLARREFARYSPHLFQPLPCLMPLRAAGIRNPVTLGGALLANELFSADRNTGVAQRARLPSGRLVSAAQCRKALSPLVESDAIAGAQWWDALATDSARLALEPLLHAAQGGAEVANRVEAVRYLVAEHRVVGVEARDAQDGRLFQIRARAVVNATGPWVAELSREAELPAHALPQAWTAALNIVIRRPLGIDRAVALTDTGSRPRRELFLVPWRGITLAGTHYERLDSAAALGAGPPNSVVQRFLRNITALAPRARLSMEDVARVHWGALPLAAPTDLLPARKPFLASGRDAAGLHGLVLLVAEKLTSAPWLAHEVLRRARQEMAVASPSRRAPSGRGVNEPPGAHIHAAPETKARLQSRYGATWRGVLRHAEREPALLRQVHASSALLAVEVVHAIRDEMALTLDDLVSRRLGLADAGAPPEGLLRAVASVAAREWGWNPGETARAVQVVIDGA